LAEDWHIRYAYRPVLLETFVEKSRFAGTCYKAANWQYLGDTQGRGKLDTLHRNAQPSRASGFIRWRATSVRLFATDSS
jgi:Druantia protein DruA